MKCGEVKTSCSPSGRGGASDGGFALVAVVSVVLLLSLVVITLMRSASSVMSTARATAERAAAEQLADGLTRLVTRHLALTPVDGTRSGNLPATGSPAYCMQGGAAAAITVTPADGQVDLNLASRDLLVFVLKGAGLAEDIAERLASEIVDYRSLGDATLSGDSKRDVYAAARLPFGPKSAPFTTVDELDQLPSMTRERYEALSPLFTVRSGVRSIDPMKASLPTLRSLRGMGLSAAEPAPNDETLARWRSETSLPPDLQAATKTRSANAGRTPPVIIEVTVWQASGARFTRRAIAALSAGDGAMARILEWSTGDTTRSLRGPTRGARFPACLGETLWVTK